MPYKAQQYDKPTDTWLDVASLTQEIVSNYPENPVLVSLTCNNDVLIVNVDPTYLIESHPFVLAATLTQIP